MIAHAVALRSEESSCFYIQLPAAVQFVRAFTGELGVGRTMFCLIKQSGAEIVGWFIGPTLDSVVHQCGDDLLEKEVLTDARYWLHGRHRLRGGKYTLLVGPGDIRVYRLSIADNR